MAGIINWRKVSPPGSNPDTNHLYVGVDPADCKLYIKDDTGAVFKYLTSGDLATELADYDLSTVVDSKISAAITALIDGAPATLDTLNELAAALADDANFASTVTTALAGKEPTITSGTTSQYWRGDKSFQTLDKSAVGLGNVDNTSDLNKPISTATQTALNLKYDASNPSGYQTAAQVSTAASSAITTHEAASDPHPQYLTSAEGNAAYQPLDGDLTAVAGLAGAGFAVRTTTNTWATRSLTTPVGSGLAITNQDGVFGSPAFTNTDKGTDAVTTHVGLSDPHSQYALDTDLTSGLSTKANLAGGNSFTGTQSISSTGTLVRCATFTPFSGQTVDTIVFNDQTGTPKSAVGPNGDILVPNPTTNFQAANKQYVDTGLNGKANLAGGNTFTGNQNLGSGLVNITQAPLNLVNSAAATLKTQLNLVNGGGGGGAGSAIDFHTYDDQPTSTQPGARIGAVDDNFSAYMGFYTKTPGSPANGINERMRIANSGEVTIGGVLGSALTNNPLSVNGTVNSYLQSNIQNLSAGTSASGDIVATANNGTDTTNYIDMGINNSTYADPSFTINGPNDGYLYINGGDLSIGTATANKIVFFTGDTLAANEKARITPTGQLALGVTAPSASAKLQIDSTTQGFLMPQMTSAQRDAIASPAAGLQVYDTNLKTICTFDGSIWIFQIALVVQNNQSSTSNTYANITELVTPVLPTGRYVFDFYGACQSTLTTNGVGIRLGAGSATISALNLRWNISQAADGTDADFQYSQLSAATNITSASVITANADFPVQGNGVFSLSAAGTVAAQIRSETNLIGCSARINSAIVIRRITG